jgi:hypothetical protein
MDQTGLKQDSPFISMTSRDLMIAIILIVS